MNVAIRTVALCAGYGGLEIGLSAALEFVGFESRVAAYVEREAYAAALLASRMETGAMDAAPIWSDLTTFDAGAWRGAVDCVTAGFPCQPHSHAGSRKGVDDERWIWPDIVRIVRESGAWLVVFENVAGLLSSGGFAPVLTDLAEMGFHAEWGVLSAGSVGASHRRERVFFVAYRHDGFSEWQRTDRSESATGTDGRGHDCGRCAAVANASGAERRRADSGWGSIGRSTACGPIDAVDNSTSPRCVAARIGPEAELSSGQCVPSSGFDELADAERPRRPPTGSGRQEHTGRQSQPGCCDLAHPSQPRRQGRELGIACDGNRGGQKAHGSVSEFRGPLFAPGPSDARWPGILAERPFLAPATEPGVRLLADGLAPCVDEHRAHQLRCGGNGVVPLQAAVGIVTLLRRLGFAE